MPRWMWSAVLGYPPLMIIAIRSVHHDPGGLRVLLPAVVMALPAVLLGHRPLVALVLMAGGTVAVVGTLGPGDARFGPTLAMVLAVGAVAATRRRAVGVGAAAAVWVALVGAEIVWRVTHGSGPAPHRVTTAAGATPLVFSALTVAVALTVGLLVRQRREHADALRAQAAARAITDERLRIARELHDSVAHSIGIIALQAGAANRVFDTQPGRAREAIGVVETASREALAELRRMLVGLRAAGGAGGPADDSATDSATDSADGLTADLADPPPAGLAGLARLASVTTAAGVRVDVRWVGTPAALPPEIDRSAFRIIQEAVTNVVRHAGVDSCRVTVEHGDGALAVEVVDDGPGRPPPRAGNRSGHGPGNSAGHGLVGMRERVALLHGDFSAGPRPQGGFRVAARLPTPVAAG